MPIREFTDSLGTRWLVWSTIPTSNASSGVLGSMRDGWLTFDSTDARRRLIPIPAGWEEASSEKLALMCRAAEPVRRTPPGGFEAVETETDAAPG